MSSKNFKISPLQGSADYTTWSIRAKGLLIQDSLGHALTTEVGRQLSKEQDEKALSKLQLLVSDSIIEQLNNYTSCKSAWEYLYNTYKPEGFTSEHLLIKRLFDAKLENFDTIEEYVNTLKNTLSKLKAREISLD